MIEQGRSTNNSKRIIHGHSQIGSLAFLHLFALATGGSLLAAQFAGDAHEQATLTKEKAADVH